jgi:hypothetical protein
MSSFFDECFTLGKIKMPKRLLIPLIIVLVAKVAGAVFIYYSMNIQALGTFWSNPGKVFNWEQNNAFLLNPGTMGRWPLTFLGWDSAWYLSIMLNGYGFSTQSYTFSPIFPSISYLTNTILQKPMVSIVLTSLVFGLLWIPIYQLLAENYMSKKTALTSALLLAFSPYLFVFTTVAYSECLLLIFVLSAWLLLSRGNFFGASAFAAIAPLTRTMGILVLLPMIYYTLKQKTHKKRNSLLSIVPIASLAAWFATLGYYSKDFLAPIHTSEWSYLYSIRTLITDGIPRYGLKAVLEAPYQPPPIPTHWLLPFAEVIGLFLPLILFYFTWKKNKLLLIYSLSGYIGILLFGALVSTPRYISVLFPLWIPLTANLSGNKKSIMVTVILLIAFYVLALDLWISFLNGQFIA